MVCAVGVARTSDAPAQAPPDSLGWHFVGNLGYVQTSGNTQLSTVNLADKLVDRASRTWTFTQIATWVYGRTGGIESANQIVGTLRADAALAPMLSAYGMAGYERNTYAGIARRVEELLGLTWAAVKTPKQLLTVDVGAGNTQQRTGGVTASYWVARLAPTYRYHIAGESYVEEGLEFLENLDNTSDFRAISSTVLVAPLTKSIAIRVGYLMRFTAQPPLDPATSLPFKKLDTTLTTGVQVTL